jgi:hypothetical protein
MDTRYKLGICLFILLGGLLITACSHQTKFVAPQMEPPSDLIPSYVPDGFEFGYGFQLPGGITWQEAVYGGKLPVSSRTRGFNLKSPDGNDIQGVFYQGKAHLILITKSYFPGGTLDAWRTAFEASGEPVCECGGFELRLNAGFSLSRRIEVEEERSINGTRIAVVKEPMGWITVFVRDDYLVTVQNGISLEENLKIAESLLKQ